MITIDRVKNVVPERFWSKIKFGELNECWEWTGTKHIQGYGHFDIGNSRKTRRLLKAHRYLYERLFGVVDNDVVVRHYVCDNTSCVNPNHLKLGTQGDNIRDMDLKGRRVSVHGASIGNSKLKEHQVIEIKSRLKNNEMASKIAKAFNVSKSLIGYIKSGRVWKHLNQ